MLVAIVSDTHGVKSILERVKSLISSSDVLIHLGDNITDLDYLKSDFKGEVFGVKGNCDFSSDEDEEKIIDLKGKRFLITHGHKYGVKFSMTSLFFRGKELGVDVILFGHTHCKMNIEEQGIWIINPGSPSLPKDGVPSIAFIEVNEESIYTCTKKV